MEKYVNCRIGQLEDLIRKETRKYAAMPEGKVKFGKTRNSLAIYIISGGREYNSKRKRRYISLSKPEAKKYATKLYQERLLPVLKDELSALTTFVQNYCPSGKYDLLYSFPEEIRTLIKNPLRSPDERSKHWATSPYDINPMEFDQRTEYYSLKGDRVRSRAELIIADILWENEIPYRYEMAYQIGSRTVYPDFTIMNPLTGELFYLEYFGLMDDFDYRQKALTKIREYYKTPDAAKFIFIFESELVSMDTTAIKNLLLSMLGLNEGLSTYYN